MCIVFSNLTFDKNWTKPNRNSPFAIVSLENLIMFGITYFTIKLMQTPWVTASLVATLEKGAKFEAIIWTTTQDDFLMSQSSTHSSAFSIIVLDFIVVFCQTWNTLWCYVTFALFDGPILNTPKHFCLFVLLPMATSWNNKDKVTHVERTGAQVNKMA
jgi:hypothetical protein